MEKGRETKRLKRDTDSQDFVLKQRYAPIEGLRELLSVTDVDYVRDNGDTYDYVLYLISLLIYKPVAAIKLFRCTDGSWHDDESDEWREVKGGEELCGGFHTFCCDDGNHDLSLKLIEGLIEQIDIDPIYCVSSAGMESLSRKSSQSGSPMPPPTTPKQSSSAAPVLPPSANPHPLISPSKTEISSSFTQVPSLPKAV
jgi:hypothetical protein